MSRPPPIIPAKGKIAAATIASVFPASLCSRRVRNPFVGVEQLAIDRLNPLRDVRVAPPKAWSCLFLCPENGSRSAYAYRSEERRVGKECGHTCGSRGGAYH